MQQRAAQKQGSAARRRDLARGWADRAVRRRAARALAHVGRAEDAATLQALPPLDDDGALDRAGRALASSLARILDDRADQSEMDDVLQTLVAACEAIAMAKAPEPKPAQMRELVQALHFTARFA